MSHIATTRLSCKHIGKELHSGVEKLEGNKEPSAEGYEVGGMNNIEKSTGKEPGMSILHFYSDGGGERYWDQGRILGSFRGFGAILANKWTVSGLNMTHNAFYHLNKV